MAERHIELTVLNTHTTERGDRTGEEKCVCKTDLVGQTNKGRLKTRSKRLMWKKKAIIWRRVCTLVAANDDVGIRWKGERRIERERVRERKLQRLGQTDEHVPGSCGIQRPGRWSENGAEILRTKRVATMASGTTISLTPYPAVRDLGP